MCSKNQFAEIECESNQQVEVDIMALQIFALTEQWPDPFMRCTCMESWYLYSSRWIFKDPVLSLMLCAPLLLFWFSRETGVYCLRVLFWQQTKASEFSTSLKWPPRDRSVQCLVGYTGSFNSPLYFYCVLLHSNKLDPLFTINCIHLKN